MTQTKLDLRGLRCPMPIVRLSQQIKKVNPGDQIIVEATDAAFEPDLSAWARQLGHKILEFSGGEVLRAVIEKGGPHG